MGKNYAYVRKIGVPAPLIPNLCSFSGFIYVHLTVMGSDVSSAEWVILSLQLEGEVLVFSTLSKQQICHLRCLGMPLMLLSSLNDTRTETARIKEKFHNNKFDAALDSFYVVYQRVTLGQETRIFRVGLQYYHMPKAILTSYPRNSGTHYRWATGNP